MLASVVALGGCWETDVDDRLHLRNNTDAPIRFDFELRSGERTGMSSEVAPGDVRPVNVPNDPDLEGGGSKCTEDPLIVLQNGEEIE